MKFKSYYTKKGRQRITKTKKQNPINLRLTGSLYLGWESNPHFRRNWILNPARLPIPPPRLEIGLQNYKLFSFSQEKFATFILLDLK